MCRWGGVGTAATRLTTGEEIRSVDVISRALDWARLTMGLVAIALVFLPSQGLIVSLGPDLKALVGLASITHVVMAFAAISGRRPGWMEVATRPIPQVVIDSALALAVLAVVDISVGPLAWIVLIVPLVSAASLIGAAGAVLTWVSLSLAYVALRFSSSPDAVSGSQALSAALQQLTTLILIAGMSVVVLRQLRLRSEDTEKKLSRATRIAERMESVASVSHRLSRSSDRLEVLEQAVEAAGVLGFVDAEVLQLRSEGNWRPIVSRLRSGSVNSRLLLDQIEAGSSGFVTDADPRWVQDLHLARYRSGFAVVLSDSPKTILQAWIGQELDFGRDDDTDGHIFRMLGEQAGMAFRNAVILDGLERQSQHLSELANSDGLTGLPNRSSLIDSIEGRLAQGSTEVGILFIDLDGFKAANDHYGHAAGDHVLRELANRLRLVLADRHIVGRLGGDEFLAVLDLGEVTDVAHDCGSIIAAFAEPIGLEEGSVRVGASIGVAIAEGMVNADELVRRADRAMYEAKRSGGEAFVLWSAELESEDDQAVVSSRA